LGETPAMKIISKGSAFKGSGVQSSDSRTGLPLTDVAGRLESEKRLSVFVSILSGFPAFKHPGF
jgi:hypothetical protein